MTRPVAYLAPGKEKSLQRRHPWIFSGAVARFDRQPEEGDWVEVRSHKGEVLATASWQRGSIALRVLEFGAIPDTEEFFARRLGDARNYRLSLPGLLGDHTNTYRLFFGEADGIPGLVVDVYGSHAVLQAHQWGVWQHKETIAKALTQLDAGITAVYDKSRESLHSKEIRDGYLIGSRTEEKFLENGFRFEVDWEKGQKTGFFLDQRDNRQLLLPYSKDKKVVNTFCYTGGFSVYALAGGAKEVISVDVSATAMELTDRNVALAKGTDRHTGVTSDVFDFLKQSPADIDVLVLDPPAFAKSRNVTHNAIQGYKRLNAMGMEKIKPGGFLFTFSCSQHITRELFLNTVRAAAMESGRPMRLVQHLQQPADHPSSLYHPEGEYLKGLVVQLG